LQAIDAGDARRVSPMPDAQPNATQGTLQAVPRQPRPADPCAMVVFGAAGDLTKRLVVPALYNLVRTNILPENFALIGVDLAQEATQGWCDRLQEMLNSFVDNAAAELAVDRIDAVAWGRLAEGMLYIQGDLTKPDLYERLRAALDEVAPPRGTTRTAGSGRALSSSTSPLPPASAARAWSRPATPGSPTSPRIATASAAAGAVC